MPYFALISLPLTFGLFDWSHGGTSFIHSFFTTDEFHNNTYNKDTNDNWWNYFCSDLFSVCKQLWLRMGFGNRGAAEYNVWLGNIKGLTHK